MVINEEWLGLCWALLGVWLAAGSYSLVEREVGRWVARCALHLSVITLLVAMVTYIARCVALLAGIVEAVDG